MRLVLSRKRLFEGIDDDDVRRERVRGVFAVGAIAVLFYLRQMNGNQPVTLIPTITPNGSPITGDFIMVFWGLYVLFTAMAFAGGKFVGNVWWKGIARRLFATMYILGRAFYAVAVIFLLVGFAVFAAEMIIVAPVIIIILLLVALPALTYPALRNLVSQRRSE